MNAAVEERTEALEVSPFQERVLAIPEDFDVFLGGGRGGGKSWALALLALRHAEQYGQRARVLYLRQSYRGIADFELICRELFGRIYGPAAKYNASEHVWRLPNGAYIELAQLEGPGDYGKFQGRSFTLLLVDEAGQYADPLMLDRLRSNLRGPKDQPLRMVLAGNPGDAGHHWLASRYVFRAAPWAPFFEPKSERTWVYAPSTYTDNNQVDQASYRKQLAASCPTDPELLRAWLEGDWTVARGAFFAGVIEESRNAVDPWPYGFHKRPAKRGFGRSGDPWRLQLAHDYGVSAPSVTFVSAVSPGDNGPDGRFYPKDSVVLVDELSTNEPGSLTKGLGWIVPILGEAICQLAATWQMERPSGVADDAIFAKTGSGAGSISDEFRRAGVYFVPAHKADRRAGWETLRRLMADAGKPDVPGLYVSRACEYFWQTVPYLARDPKKPDDVDSRGPDHAADAARYAVIGINADKVTWQRRGW